MAKSRIQTRVDDTRKREVERYADEHDITQAEAVRRLVGRGIDYEQGLLTRDDDSGDDTLPRLGDALALIGALSWVASIFAVVPWLFLPGAASIIAAGLVFLVTGYGGGVLVGLGATLWMWSAAPDASLVDVARARVFSRAEVAK